MSSSRLRKRIERSLVVLWREQPTRYDIEALQANVRRVGLVVRVRWVLLVVLVVYSVLAGLLYATRIPVPELAQLMWIPALALGMVVLYNTYYSLNYRRLGSIAVWNHLQLGLDAAVVTVLVYFSGGADSWFWSMYSLFILEAAFIFPRRRDTWLLALLCLVLLGGIELLELTDVLPHSAIPYSPGAAVHDATYVAVRYLWQVAVIAGTAGIANLLAGESDAEAAARTAQSILDRSTGLYSRSYFMRACPREIHRAEKDHRLLHLLLLDIDRFGEFNNRFGVDRGDRLLKLIAEEIESIVGSVGDSATDNLVARIGGEEIAILLAERDGHDARAEDAVAVAERVRAAVERVRVDDAGVTVSIGIASMPTDGRSTEELLDAADAALSVAIEGGGNRVGSATELDAANGADWPDTQEY